MFENVVELLGRLDRSVSDAVRVDQLAALERVKAACAAAQARVTADFAVSQERVAAACRQRARECADASDVDGWVAARDQVRRATVDSMDAAGGRGERSGRADEPEEPRGARRRAARPGASFGVAGQVALARRESPSQGSRHLAMALALIHRLPRTLTALESGAISEWRAEIVVRECAVLTPEQQSALDAELFETLGDDRISTLGDRELAHQVRAIAYRVDAASVLARARGEERQRRVTLRPAPDTMCYLTAYLPVAQGVAVHAGLVTAAASARAGGDDRSKSQLMADLLVERATGQTSADAVPVEVQLVVTDQALLTTIVPGGPAGEVAAQVPGYGTVPAAWARELVRENAARVWLRRLYIHPQDGSLVAMDSQRRTFTGGLRRFLIARDGTCTTPWCDAPIAHLDHITPHAAGGPTNADNGRGTCVRCNLTKESPGWRAAVTTMPFDEPASASPVTRSSTRRRSPARTERSGGAPPRRRSTTSPRKARTEGTFRPEAAAPSIPSGSVCSQPRTITITTPTGHRYPAYARAVVPGSVGGPHLADAAGHARVDGGSMLERRWELLMTG